MSEKQLDCTQAAGEHQKLWFAQLRKDVFEKRRPYAIVQADMPFELFHVMDVPVVSNQWWASIISAKRLSGHYLDIINSMGFHEGLCRYCSLAAASTLANDPERAPWGGLPKPALLSARLTCDCLQRVFALWGEAFGSECVFFDNPGATAPVCDTCKACAEVCPVAALIPNPDRLRPKRYQASKILTNLK